MAKEYNPADYEIPDERNPIRDEKLMLVADMVGRATNAFAELYEMPADGLTMGEAMQVIRSTERLQRSAMNTQRWLFTLAGK